MIATTPTRTTTTAPIAVLYENEAWMTDLFAALAERGIAFDAIDLSDGAFDLDDPGAHRLVINRVSPSADMRGNGSAIGLARGWLDAVERRGTRVLNGARAFGVETSKVAQYQLIRELGLQVPKTAVFSGPGALRRLADDFPFPAILKPDTGGSGVGIRFVGSRRELERLLEAEPELTQTDSVLLLQEFVSAPDGTIMRMEFVGDELIYSMRVLPENTFNLCPADGCERPPADGDGEADATFEHAPDVSDDAVAEARAIVRTAGLDIGGVEYIETADGTRWFYDINATSVYRSDIAAAAGVNAMDRLVDHIEHAARVAQATEACCRRAA
jgi:glutathione synthase/RimK-type ligase-like ATP-grasp enzyme